MIGEAVGSLDDQASMTPVLENLGNRHFHYGVKQDFYLVCITMYDTRHSIPQEIVRIKLLDNIYR